MIRLIFIGRMVPEKGREMIHALIRFFANNQGYSQKIHLDICGQGPGEKDLINYQSLSRLTYHGRCSQDTIITLLQQTNFSLMPSHFWETFGLSALESVSQGVPVIGIKQAGLEAFIHDDLACSHDSDDFIACVLKALSLGSEHYSMLVRRSNQQADNYSFLQRQKKLFHLIPKQSKVLIISDYISAIGGIEKHVIDITNVLSGHDCLVSVHGKKLSSSSRSIIQRLSAVAISLFRWTHKNTISLLYKKTKPHIVWFHSISRRWGPRVLRGIPLSGTPSLRTIISFHDFGYIAPFAQFVYSERDIPSSPTLWSWIYTFWNYTTYKRHILKKIFWTIGVVYKRLLIRAIWYGVNHRVSQILVPSACFIPFCAKYCVHHIPIDVFAPGYSKTMLST